MLRVAWLANYPYLKLRHLIRLRRDRRGHPSSWVVNLADSIASSGCVQLHVVLLCPHVTYRQVVEEKGVVFHVLPSGIPFTGRGFPYYLPIDVLTGFRRERKAIVSEIIEIGPHIVHAFGTEGAYALSGIDSRVPCIIAIQGIMGEYVKVAPSIGYRFMALCEKHALRSGKHFSCRTGFDSGYVHLHNPLANIYMIPEIMGASYFTCNWKAEKDPSVLFVGELCRRKGIEDLLEAVKQVSVPITDIRVRIVGTGVPSYVKFLQQKCEDLGIVRHIEFLGYRSPEQLARLHEESQTLVLPSLMDNSPNCVAEAMVSGLPVIATDVGGIRSLIEENKTGLLVPSHSPDKLAQTITALLQDINLRKTISNCAKAIARPRHDPKTVTEATISAYRDVIQQVMK